MLDKITNWEFLDEPLYRWVIFIFALGLIGIAWRGVVQFMHEA